MKTIKIIFKGKSEKLANALYISIITKLKEDKFVSKLTEVSQENKDIIMALRGEDKDVDKAFSGNFSFKNRLALKALGFKIEIESIAL